MTEEFNPENLQSQYIPTPSSDKNNNEITIKKSTYNKLLTGLVITIAVAAFFSGNEKDGFVKLSGAQPYSAFQSVIEDQLS